MEKHISLLSSKEYGDLIWPGLNVGREGCINRKDIFTGCIVPGTGRSGAKRAPFPLCWHFFCCTLERPQRVNGNSCQTASFCSHNKAPGNIRAGGGEQGAWLCPSLPQLSSHFAKATASAFKGPHIEMQSHLPDVSTNSQPRESCPGICSHPSGACHASCTRTGLQQGTSSFLGKGNKIPSRWGWEHEPSNCASKLLGGSGC